MKKKTASFIEERFEAGIVFCASEVPSVLDTCVRMNCALEVVIQNVNIAEYSSGMRAGKQYLSLRR
jgi:tmRNA-binding protein